MGVKVFAVVLRPRLPVYFPTQTITGFVRVENNSTIKYRGLIVRCGGIGYVFWQERSRRRTIKYIAKEFYGEKRVNLLPAGGESRSLEPGTHEFPFSFVLPSEAPSSFEGLHGYVRYRVKAELDIVLSFDKKAKTFFSFCQPYDLNRNPKAKKPLSERREHTWGIGPFKHGPVTVELKAPSPAAVCGSVVPLHGSARNDGNSKVNVTISLKQKVLYRVKKYAQMENRLMCEAKFVCPPHETIQLSNVKFKIPAVVPHLQFCTPIDVRYVLQVKAAALTSKAVLTEIPFFIGTVPLVSEEEAADAMYGRSPQTAAIKAQEEPAPAPSVSKCFFSGERKISRHSKLRMKSSPPNYVVLSPK